MSRQERMVIVGGGQCGARKAHALRANGWDGAITLLGSERALHYERPPLSKSVLTDECSTSQCALLRTLDASIFAAGDVCSLMHPLFDKRIRLECWDRWAKLRSLLTAEAQ